MAMMASRSSVLASGFTRVSPSLPLRSNCAALRVSKRVQASQRSEVDLQAQAVKAASWATLGSTFLMAGNAAAATEVMSQAAGDGRGAFLVLFPAVAIGWVLFQILGPAQEQLQNMKVPGGAPAGKRVAAVVGMTAAALAASQPAAEAATEVAQVAADGRGTLLLAIPAIAIGWVLFQILEPALAQLDGMSSRGSPVKKRARSVIALATAASTLAAAQSADAATEVAQLAADGRTGLIASLFIPVVGWVLFNIGSGALAQFNDVASKGKPTRR